MAPPPPTTPDCRPSTATTIKTTNTPSAQSTPSPVPPPVPVETHPNRAAFKQTTTHPPTTTTAKTTTEPVVSTGETYRNYSPPRLRPLTTIHGPNTISAAAALRPAVASLRAPPAIPPVAARLAEEKKNRRRRHKQQQPYEWKKLLWVKQHGYPDNYTDVKTFLDHLQRNPRLHPYDFWQLMADSTVIVQHVCSVVIFTCAYAGIYQDRLSPVTVVMCGTFATLVGWILWDYWIGQEEAEERSIHFKSFKTDPLSDTSSAGYAGYFMPVVIEGDTVIGTQPDRGLGLSLSTTALENLTQNSNSKHTQSLSRSSFQSISPIELHAGTVPFPKMHLSPEDRSKSTPSFSYFKHSPTALPQSISTRNQVRLKTFKSALLIYFTLLGLSPILKSLTKSTSSDSIWALATWLLIINIFFFDYGSVHVPTTLKPNINQNNPNNKQNHKHLGKPSNSSTTNNIENTLRINGVAISTNEPLLEPKTVLSTASTSNTPTDPALAPTNTSVKMNTPPFPSSLSTNAALMASTVLASRLLTTTAVFSLTLFSIQVFGLFPVFRRHLRYRSAVLHFLLTVALVSTSNASLSLILSQSYTHRYGNCGYCLGWIAHVVLRSMIGVIVGGIGTLFILGGCSWWLIGLQRYKNVVIGPWDPAKPVLAGGVYGRSRTGTD